MTGVRPDVDLAALQRARDTVKPPRRTLKYVVPIAIVLAFGGILAVSLRDVFERTVDVTVIRPKAATEGAGMPAPAGAALLQAAGWVEAEPFPLKVTALASGVIAELLVKESDAVKAGDPVARLVDQDARLQLAGAEASLAEALAEEERARIEEDYAKRTFDAALAVTENAAASEARATGKAAEKVHRAQAVLGAESDLRVAEEEAEIQRKLAASGAAGPRAVELAEARVRAAAAALEVMRADAAIAAAEAEEARARAVRAARDRELRLDDGQRVESAAAMRALARAKVRSAEVARDEARLRLDRMTIRATADGIVLERVAVPGDVLHAEDPTHAVAVLLFDPKSIRVRVDVSQSDLGLVSVGQKVEIQSQVRRATPYHGEVIRIVQKADIQKVTMQAHVRVLDGDVLLRPEMLCQARFLASGGAAAASAPAEGAATLMVPARVLVDERFVWALDADGVRARKRPVEIAGRSGEWALVRAGLNVTDKVIDLGREQVADGTRVRARLGE